NLPAISMPKIDDSFAQALKQRKINQRHIKGLGTVDNLQRSILYTVSPLLH
ncbi:unnamed protein product, partial [Allacma fusca]